jgi:hypothetical protein
MTTDSLVILRIPDSTNADRRDRLGRTRHKGDQK